MGDFSAMGSAIYTLVDNATTVPVFYALAPQGSAWPFAIVQRQDAQDEYTFTGAGVAADYLVKVVSRDYWPTGAQRVYDGIHGQIQGGGTAGTVTGYNLLRFERQSTIEYRDPDNYWHVGGLYRVEVWEV